MKSLFCFNVTLYFVIKRRFLKAAFLIFFPREFQMLKSCRFQRGHSITKKSSYEIKSFFFSLHAFFFLFESSFVIHGVQEK